MQPGPSTDSETPVEITLERLIEQLEIACEEDRWHPVGDLNPNADGVAGDVLESFMGVPMNNLSLPDYGIFELKTHRRDANSLVTLFHFSPNPRPFSSRPFTDVYGWPHPRRDELAFACTVSSTGTSRGFFMELLDDRIYLRHNPLHPTVNREQGATDQEEYETIGEYIDQLVANNEYANRPALRSENAPANSIRVNGFRNPPGENVCEIYWDLVDNDPDCTCCGRYCLGCMNIESRINLKLQNTVYVEFERRTRNGQYQYRYQNAWLLTTLSLENFRNSFNNNHMRCDFNLYAGRDHGTSFRISSSNLSTIFDNSRQLIRDHEIVNQQ